MPATKAQVLVPGLLVQDAAPAADAEALDRLALWVLQRYAPIVTADLPDGIVLDTTGADHLHGGEQAMLAGKIDRPAGSGIFAWAAVADTWGTAHALARSAGRSNPISPPGTADAPTAPFPHAAPPP